MGLPVLSHSNSLCAQPPCSYQNSRCSRICHTYKVSVRPKTDCNHVDVDTRVQVLTRYHGLFSSNRQGANFIVSVTLVHPALLLMTPQCDEHDLDQIRSDPLDITVLVIRDFKFLLLVGCPLYGEKETTLANTGVVLDDHISKDLIRLPPRSNPVYDERAATLLVLCRMPAHRSSFGLMRVQPFFFICGW